MYGREAPSRLYEWHRRLQTRLGNALLLWMARRYHGVPERTGHRIGAAIGAGMRWISPRHYRIVMANLRLAFGGEKSEEEMAAIAAACYRHLGKCLMEFIRLPAMNRDEIRRVTDLRGAEHLDRSLELGRGVILLTGHLGNWEMVGARIAADGYPLNVIARAQRQQELTDYVRRTREVAGMRVFHREVAVRRSLQALRRNELVGILLDQNAGAEGVFVEFFGHPASTAPGAAAFAIRTGAAVVPTFGWRNPDDSHTIQIDAPVPLVETGDREKDILDNTQRFAKITEDRIRAHPDQWFWLHKRWKSRPPQKTGV
jgi:KDO2-lipid IV(A) lauroyltransferase